MKKTSMILVFAALAIVILNGCTTGEAKGGIKPGQEVIANSCNADGICEVNQLKANEAYVADGQKLTTREEVLQTLVVGSYGGCNFVEVPYGYDWQDNMSDDYNEVTLPFINADANGDGITTGAEYCESRGAKCLFGFRKFKIDIPESMGRWVTTDQIGCWGGSSYEDLAQPNAEHENYYCCSTQIN